MARNSIRPSAVAAVVALALVVSACSSSGSGGGGSSTTPASASASAPSFPSTSAAAPTTAAAAPSPSASALSPDEIRPALLTTSDLGAGFANDTFTSSDKPLPCGAAGSPSFDTQAPTTMSAGARLTNDTLGIAFEEEIRVYDTTADADAAVNIAARGLNCTQGKLYATDGTTVTVKIAAPQDVTSDVGGDKAGAWQVTSSEVDVLYIAVEIERAIVLLGFTRDPAADTAKLPNPLTVAKAAIDKIKAS